MDPADGSDPIVQLPPLLCIQVLSPENSPVRMRARFDHYLAMGVRKIWVFDPLERVCYHADEQVIVRTAGTLSIPGTPVQVLVAEVFARLDFLLAGKF